MNQLLGTLFNYLLPVVGFIIGFVAMRLRAQRVTIVKLQQALQQAKDSQALSNINNQIKQAEEAVKNDQRALNSGSDNNSNN